MVPSTCRRSRMARPWGCGTLAACTILLSSLAVAQQPARSMFTDKTKVGNELQTPPHGFIFPSSCAVTADTSIPRPVICKTVSFHVLLNHSMAQRLQFFVNGDLRAGSEFNPTDQAGCEEPIDKAYDQQCGMEELLGPNRVPPDVHTGTCIPSCDYLTGNGLCKCEAGTSGSCTCFRAWRFTVQPSKFANLGRQSVCFNATSRTAGTPVEARCVYFDLMVPPLSLSAINIEGKAMYKTEAVVGQQLRIPVQALDMNSVEVVSIKLVDGMIELPDGRWEGDSFCKGTGSTLAGITSSCPDGRWQRNLLYTPRLSEAGMEYTIYFTAMDDGLGPQTTENQTLYKQGKSLAGSACGVAYGLCPYSGSMIGVITPEPLLSVSVVQKNPLFMQGIANKQLYVSPGGPVNQVLGSYEGTPAANSRWPALYVNCPMRPFGVYAFKNDSTPTIVLEPSDMSPTSYGLVVTENVYYWNEPGGKGRTDINAYYSYVGVTWTPPLGSEGRDYLICFRAFDTFSSSTMCITLPVTRCMYCTSAKESLKQIAERFNTHWLQVWSANDAELALMQEGEMTKSAVQGWKSTEDPHQIDPGVALRLGPVYVTRHDVRLGTVAQRYQTTVESLLQMNPDLRHEGAGADDVIGPGQEVCLLPHVCTAAAGGSD